LLRNSQSSNEQGTTGEHKHFSKISLLPAILKSTIGEHYSGGTAADSYVNISDK